MDPRYLRNAESRGMVQFAQVLFEQTNGLVPIGRAHFPQLWMEATAIAAAG